MPARSRTRPPSGGLRVANVAVQDAHVGGDGSAGLAAIEQVEVKAAFDGGAGARPGNGTADVTFALSLVGMLALGAALTAIAALLL